MLLAPSSPRPRAVRPGTATLWMLGILMVGTAVMVSVLEIYRLQAARVETQDAADAAATAAARRLIDDTMLVGDSQTVAGQFTAARSQARLLALCNGLLGDSALVDGQPNAYGSDVVLGRVDPARSDKIFYAGDLSAFGKPPPVDILINAVQVNAPIAHARQGSLFWRNVAATAQSTAILDRDVIGFQAVGSLPVPLAPIALLSDPTAANTVSWEYLVEQGNGPDNFRYDRNARILYPTTDSGSPQSDGLHEMALSFRGTVNACVLQLGVSQWSDMTAQVTNGVTPAQLRTLPNSELVLNASGQARLPTFPFPASDTDPDAQSLYAALATLEADGAARAFPLFTSIDASGNATLTGFVAARVARPYSGESPVQVIIQPCMIAVPAAVTDPSRRPANQPAGNPYVCKIRIVQ